MNGYPVGNSGSADNNFPDAEELQAPSGAVVAVQGGGDGQSIAGMCCLVAVGQGANSSVYDTHGGISYFSHMQFQTTSTSNVTTIWYLVYEPAQGWVSVSLQDYNDTK